VTGAQFKEMIKYVLRDEAFVGEHTEFYQYSKGVKIVYDKAVREILEFTFNQQPLDEQAVYTIGIQDFHFNNFEMGFGFPLDELLKNGKSILITTSTQDVLREYFTSQLVPQPVGIEGRLIIKNR
jgi:5'-nucleotidase